MITRDLYTFYLFFCLSIQNTPEVSDSNKAEHVDVLVVNIIRGTLLPDARIWILGRRPAVSQIPSKFIDVFTELQGFRSETVFLVFLYHCVHFRFHISCLAFTFSLLVMK